jgi:hypothetical protein
VTPNEIKALDYIRKCISIGGFSPSYREIATAVGVSGAAAHGLAANLAALGHIRLAPLKTRGIELPAVDVRAASTESLQAELARRGVIPGALSRPGNRKGATKPCAAEGCTDRVSIGHAFCWDHWNSISEPTRNAMMRAHRAVTRDPSEENITAFQDAFGRARDEATMRHVERFESAA